MSSSGRVPSWLLVVATGLICAATLKLESANLFPVWRFAVQWSPAALPSSRAAPMAEIASGVPVLSLSLDQADVLDPAKGLLPNKRQHGPDWEREGSVSYFEHGRLVFASGVGVRVHGGGSRITAPRPGFRLYFRRKYGPREVPPGVLFSTAAQPIRRLVVHDDVRRDTDGTRWYFVNPLAYDVARVIGAIAPETKPVRFFLNGEYYGPFVLTERFDEHYFAAHWGYDDILLHQDAMETLWSWVTQTRPLTMKAVSQHINIDNLTKWFLAVTFCATRDTYQGPGQFLDQTRREAGWFWVNWDMDQSFRDWNHDTYQYMLERISEGRRGRNRAEPRAILLTQLIADDPEYRDFLKRAVQRALNHQLTDVFLKERYEHYLDIASQLRVPTRDYLQRLQSFLERRPAFYRLITEQWLNSAPSQPVTFTAPANVALVVDGERVSTGFQGMYFPDLEVTVDVAAQHRTGFRGWRINGRDVPGAAPLTFAADRPTVVEAVFEGSPAGTPAAEPRAAPVHQTGVPRIVWRAIPAGTSWMGCVPGDTQCADAERPRVETAIAEPFELMDREVSAVDFRAYAAATSQPMARQPEWYADDTHPVVNITWDEAQAYCAWTGGRLPTEPEWEHAARGGLDGQLFPWGNEFTGQAVARHNLPAEKFPYTAPVGSLPPNAYGLYDMAGNVWELTSSEHRPTHAAGPSTGAYELRTIKGGAWDSSIRRLRASERAAVSRQGRHNLYVGFRCARAVRN